MQQNITKQMFKEKLELKMILQFEGQVLTVLNYQKLKNWIWLKGDFTPITS